MPHDVLAFLGGMLTEIIVYRYSIDPTSISRTPSSTFSYIYIFEIYIRNCFHGFIYSLAFFVSEQNENSRQI